MVLILEEAPTRRLQRASSDVHPPPPPPPPHTRDRLGDFHVLHQNKAGGKCCFLQGCHFGRMVLILEEAPARRLPRASSDVHQIPHQLPSTTTPTPHPSACVQLTHPPPTPPPC